MPKSESPYEYAPYKKEPEDMFRPLSGREKILAGIAVIYYFRSRIARSHHKHITAELKKNIRTIELAEDIVRKNSQPSLFDQYFGPKK